MEVDESREERGAAEINDGGGGRNREPAIQRDDAIVSYEDHRRLERGCWFYTPCLGWKEFVPDYAGPFRDGTAPSATKHHDIPAFREMGLDHPQNGRYGNLN